ncbi:BgTH12-04567 [Blumeria graminis f. sp. triticale]|uniref:BgTH12-04567 n=1 Tax=Blumeria graminis f. sp. triticale TaxID=1689686 RepID=A0A9W4DG85_BLUGR|nr:BgTH12-04567 [Blumeria graminis f. sp. triticale]
MQMGANQYFVDYLQDFELKLSQCSGTGWLDFNKITYLNTGINATLRFLLLNKTMSDNNHEKWVSKVKNFAGRLENTPEYRPKSCSGKKTWYIPQNGNNSQPTFGKVQSNYQLSLDANGDTNMGGISSLPAL